MQRWDPATGKRLAAYKLPCARVRLVLRHSAGLVLLKKAIPSCWGSRRTHTHRERGVDESHAHTHTHARTQVTSCAFGGDHLDQLYITTVREVMLSGVTTPGNCHRPWGWQQAGSRAPSGCRRIINRMLGWAQPY